MNQIISVFILVLCFVSSATCQKTQQSIDLSEYLGGWGGDFNIADVFNYEVYLNVKDQNIYVNFISKLKKVRIDLETEDGEYYTGSYEDQLELRLKYNDDNPILFVKIGRHLCHLGLEKVANSQWYAKWNLLLTNSDKANFFLSFDRNDDNSIYASLFIKEPTFHYLSAEDFQVKGDYIQFIDSWSRMRFSGRLVDGNAIHLDVEFLGQKVSMTLAPQDYSEWNLGEVQHQTIIYSDPKYARKFSGLTKAIQEDSLEKTHSVVILKEKKIIYEAYFDGFDRKTVHDTRSVAKSFVSALIGIAIKKQFLDSEKQLIKPFFENEEIDWSNKKDNINIKHLLTMSSGLDAIDFGLNRTSFANEGNFQNSEEWSQYIISAPMVYTPGEEANYGSGSPQLLADVLTKSIDQPLEYYIHDELFRPLDIDNYRIQLTNKDQPYFGGGWYFTPQDLIKFGQLYLQDGRSKGKSIITKSWAKKSIAKHIVLKNTFDQNQYGYLFWHKSYQIDGSEIESVECRGTGGQYVFIVPEENVVVVITSGNYSNGKGFQPEKIMQEYILPEILD